MMENIDPTQPCALAATISDEQFIPEHLLIYLIAGSFTAYDGHQEYQLQPGDYCLVCRNHLARYSKRPPENGTFKAYSIVLNQAFLKSFIKENAGMDLAAGSLAKDAFIKLEPNALLENFTQSIGPYLDLPRPEKERFLLLKQHEILLILLKTNPELMPVLFDFSDPGKIDLEAFMNRNYKFNVSMQRFGYLTGRSITTFKRDFERIFNSSPGRWLLERRLEEAHFLIRQKGAKPSDVYLEVGFEDLSHFSYAFKKKYGVSPRQLKE